MQKKKSQKLASFVLGARPPQTLSPKAKRQLISTKPSKMALELADKASKALPGKSIYAVAKTVSDVATTRTSKKKIASVK